MSYFGRRDGALLELGPFAGGITFELAGIYPNLNLTIADENLAYIQHLRSELISRALSGRVRVLSSRLNQLAFPEESFDFVIFRGAFFFIMTCPDILVEIQRILKPGAKAFVGGGYGKNVPSEVIAEIAEESRALNDRLGRRRVGINEIRKLLVSVELDKKACILEEGGIWILLRK